MNRVRWMLCGLGMLALCCRSGPATPVDPAEIIAYTAHIRPIFAASCLSCHTTSVTGEARQGAPINANLDTYTAARRIAEAANHRIQTGLMPPSAPLGEEQKDLVQLWISQGIRE